MEDNLINNWIKKQDVFLLKTNGNSMLPLIQSGDIINYQKIKFSQTQINDLILVYKQKKYFTHRVVYKTKRYLITQGDNNSQDDGKILPHQTVAKVINIKRNKIQFSIEDIYLIQSSLYLQEIIKIKEELTKAKVDYVFLKGLPLYLYLDHNYPKRIYADCDLLVNPKDKYLVRKILNQVNFTKLEDNGLSYQSFAQKPIIEENYYKVINDFPLVFDIHYDISISTVNFPKLNQQFSKLTLFMLGRKHLIKTHHESFPILNKEDLVLYLCIHQVNHYWKSIFRFNFINQVVKKYSFHKKDWSNIIDQAKKYQIINFLVPSFFLLKKYYQLNESYVLCQKKYPNNLLYSLFIYEHIIKSKYFFTFKKKKLLIRFLMYDSPLLKKMSDLFNLKFISYLIYYLFNKKLDRT